MRTVWIGCRQNVCICFSGDVLPTPRAVGTRRPNVKGQPSFVYNYVRTVDLNLEGSSRVRVASS